MDRQTETLKWVNVRFEDIGSIVGGGTPATIEPDYFSNDIAWLTPRDLSGYHSKYISKGERGLSFEGLKKSSAKLLPKNSVLLTSRAPIGYVAIAENDICTNQGFKSMVLNEKVAYHEFVYYYLKYKEKELKEIGTGTTFKEISGSTIKKFPICIPPINEQHRIVLKIDELLSELDNGTENLFSAKAQLRVYHQAVLKWAFDGLNTHDSQKNIVSLCKMIDNPRYGTSKKCSTDPHGSPVLRIPNVSNGIIDKSELKYATFDAGEVKSLKLCVGDILIIRSNGSTSLVGRPAIIRDTDVDCLFAGYLIRIRPNCEVLDSQYLLYYLQSPEGRKYIESKAKSSSGVKNINAKEIMELSLPVFCLTVQKQIVQEIETRLSICDKMEETIAECLKKVEVLRQSILKKAFEGRLVPQDPNDEPADKLLDRIRSEKESPAYESKSIRKGRGRMHE